MSLISMPFALLAVMMVVCCRITPARWHWPILLCGSLFFYGYAGMTALAWAIGDVALCFTAAIAIEKLREAGVKNAANAVRLGIICAQCAWMLLLRGYVPGASYIGLIALGYVLDVGRGEARAERNSLFLGAFALFFPQAAQGPIVRFEQTALQLREGKNANWDDFCDALLRILWGLLKKLVLADRMAVFVNAVFLGPGSYSAGMLWLTLLCYAIQIYADFSGCMDIVLGSAALLGIRLPENFRRPYFADGFAAYWQRWHITMGAWFRVYVFYPLSTWPRMMAFNHHAMRGNKSPALRRAAAVFAPLLLTWLLTGLWHGAAAHYAVWGLVNGLLILWESCAPKRFARWPKGVRICCVFFVQLLVRVLFRAQSMGDALLIYGALFRFKQGAVLPHSGLDAADWLVAFVAAVVLFVVDLMQEKQSCFTKKMPGYVRFALALAGVFALLIFGRYGPGYDPAAFFYGRF